MKYRYFIKKLALSASVVALMTLTGQAQAQQPATAPMDEAPATVPVQEILHDQNQPAATNTAPAAPVAAAAPVAVAPAATAAPVAAAPEVAKPVVT